MFALGFQKEKRKRKGRDEREIMIKEGLDL
jgi:hypothetical protein